MSREARPNTAEFLRRPNPGNDRLPYVDPGLENEVVTKTVAKERLPEEVFNAAKKGIGTDAFALRHFRPGKGPDIDQRRRGLKVVQLTPKLTLLLLSRIVANLKITDGQLAQYRTI